MRDIIFGGLWAIMYPLSFYSAHLGILLWIWVALIGPNELMYGILGSVPFNKLVAFSALMVLMFNRRLRKDFYFDGLMGIVAAYAFIVTLSYLFAHYSSSFSDFLYDKFWKELLLAVLITGIMFTRARLHQTTLVVGLAFGFYMVKEGLIFLLTAGGHKITGIASTGDNNGFACAILMAIPLVLYCANYTEDRWVRLVMQITAGLGAVTVMATYSRGGFVGLVVLGIMLLRGSRYKIRTIIAVALCAVALYYISPADYTSRIDTITSATQDNSFMTRVVAWKINLLMAMDHPFLGAGLYACTLWSNWSVYADAASTFLFPTPPVYKTFVAHSIYFQVLGDTGFTGFILFLIMFATALYKTMRTRKLARQDPSLVWAADLARATQTSIVVYLVAGAALSLVYFELIYIILAVVSRNHRTVVEALAARVPARARRPAGLAPAYRPAM
ncbi:MAG TPA: putative O-glycosylation ligase, exosortase A system-associated [Acetobacteraceae bacterium]|nr:putative O-glycosylation ligase, exosortase A system-associated [Acetobacteraceae bacterium]